MNTNAQELADDGATILAGKYRLEEVIGTGGMGTVYRARHLVLGSPVAVKLMHRSGDPVLAERFLREARLAASARHPNVVSILDFGTTDDDQPFMVMEFLEGRSLSDYIESPGSLSLEAQVSIIAQVLSGLDSVHRAGIIHRDMKPANIFVTQLEDGRHFARLLDFGISFSVDPDSALRRGRFGTDEQLIIGTPEYMSFEQAQGRVDIDERADVYAVGVMLYELLSGGHLPFADPNPGGVLFKIFAGTHVRLEQLRPDLPALAAVVERALSSDREARPPTARALRRDLLTAMGTPIPEVTDSAIPMAEVARARRNSDRPTRASDAHLVRPTVEPGVSSGAPSLPYLERPRRRWLAPTLGGALVLGAGLLIAALSGAVTPDAEAPVASSAGVAPPREPPSVPSVPTVASTPPDGGSEALRVPPSEGVLAAESDSTDDEVGAPARVHHRTATPPARRDPSSASRSERRGLRPGLIVRDLDF